MYKVYFLTGCTATGKTAAAHILARRLNAVVLSADSMLVYHGMDIGTAKPTPAERAEVEYAGIDLVYPGMACDLSVFYNAAMKAVQTAHAARKPVIVVGGTGLYLNCLLCGMDDRPPAHPALRTELQSLLDTGGVDALAERLKSVALGRYERMTDSDRRNPRRLVRAIELAVVAPSKGISDYTDASPANIAPIPALRLPAEQLHTAIAARVWRMFDAGLIDEVRGLTTLGVNFQSTAGQAIGYAECLAYLRGECGLNEAMQLIVTRTRRLAKKQMTWFRNKLKVDWLDVTDDMSAEARAGLVMEYWRTYGPVDIMPGGPAGVLH